MSELREGKVYKRKYKQRRSWVSRAENLLFELWAENILELRSVRKNFRIYKNMAATLNTHGFCFSAGEIKTKMQNLSTKYRAEKSKCYISGGSPSTWEHYNTVHQILGSLKSKTVEKFVEDSLMCKSEESMSPSISSMRSASPVPSTSSPACSLMASPEIDPLLAASSQIVTPPSMSTTKVSSSSNPPDRNNQSFHNEIFRKIESIEHRIEKQHQEMLGLLKDMAESFNKVAKHFK